MSYVRELGALVGHRPLVLAVGGARVFDPAGRLLLHGRDDNRLRSHRNQALAATQRSGGAARQSPSREARPRPKRLWAPP